MTTGTAKTRSKTSSFGVGARVNHDSAGFYQSKMYQELGKQGQKTTQTDNPFPPALLNQILCKSAESMAEIPDNSLHLMITSPPYNVQKDYDEDLSFSEYLALLRSVFSETYRVLVDGGRACINVANLGRRPYIPLSDHISLLMTEIGFAMRGEIIWNKASSAGSSTAWGSWQSASNPILRDVHEYILIFSKGAYKREAKGKRNTINRDEFMEWTKSIWQMNAVSAKKIGHPAPFPQELPHRLIQLYSFEGDIILDPFMGSGTTALAAKQAGRLYIGYEISADYHRLASVRLSQIL